MPQIIASENSEEIINLFRIIKSDPILLNNIEYVQRVGQRRWDVKFSNDITLKLPENDADMAYEKFTEINKEKKILNKDIKYIDMRIEGQIVVGN